MENPGENECFTTGWDVREKVSSDDIDPVTEPLPDCVAGRNRRHVRQIEYGSSEPGVRFQQAEQQASMSTANIHDVSEFAPIVSSGQAVYALGLVTRHHPIEHAACLRVTIK